MPVTTTIEGLVCTLEKLANGNIRISHQGTQFNSMQGPATGGEYIFEINPVQRHQYEFFNAYLPPEERSIPPRSEADRPWWSFGSGQGAGLRE